MNNRPLMMNAAKSAPSAGPPRVEAATRGPRMAAMEASGTGAPHGIPAAITTLRPPSGHERAERIRDVTARWKVYEHMSHQPTNGTTQEVKK